MVSLCRTNLQQAFLAPIRSDVSAVIMLGNACEVFDMVFHVIHSSAEFVAIEIITASTVCQLPFLDTGSNRTIGVAGFLVKATATPNIRWRYAETEVFEPAITHALLILVRVDVSVIPRTQIASIPTSA